MDFAKYWNSGWGRRAAWAFGGLLAFWALAWLAVPPLVKGQAEKAASQKLGRAVTIGAVEFRPWTLELTVRDLAVAMADGSRPQLSIRRIHLDGELQSLLRLAPVVDEVLVEEPALRLTHLGGGRYDIDDILARVVPPAGEPASDAPRFALYNLLLTGGRADFTDKAVNRTHELRALGASLPFLSNLASQREVKVQPRLAFELNGSRFDSAAEGTPFAQTRHTEARIRLAGLDLTPYLGYIPASVPVRLRSAVLDADLHVSFEQAPRVAVIVKGTAGARDVKLAGPDGKDLLAFERLGLVLEDVRPLEKSARIASAELTAPILAAARDAAGRLNLDVAGAAGTDAAPATAAASITPTTATPAAGWKLALAKASLRSGTVNWADATTRPAAALAVTALSLDAAGFEWPFARPAEFSGAAALGKGSVTFAGFATDRAGTVTAAVSGLPLETAGAYAAAFLEPALSGLLDAQAALAWSGDALAVDVKQAALHKVLLGSARQPAASVQKLEVAGARVDMAAARLTVERVAVTQPKVAVERGEDGRWMFEKWLRASPAAGKDRPPASAAWDVVLDDVSIAGGSAAFMDRSQGKPVAFEVSGLQAQVKKFAPLATGRRELSPLTLSAKMSAGSTQPGSLSFRGALGLSPVAAQGRVEALHVPLHAFEPYFAGALNMELLRADGSFRGAVRFQDAGQGPAVRVSGDAALEDFRANSVPVRGSATQAAALPVSEELLSWKALGLRGVEFAMAPGSATSVSVRETALSDFFARVVINESGRINLQDIVKASVPAGVSSSIAATSTVAAPAPAAKPPAPDGGPVIAFGPVSLVNGRVLFSDRFIRPNYSADLSELTGRLSAFSSASPAGTPQLADLELRGRAEGTASLEVLGKLNPLAKPLALDIKGRVRDLELPPLSPYTIKYAGHGIQRGKLSMDVAYVVRPDGQLTASNRLVLNQLSFGDKVDGAPNSLPVKLAVALLADRNGVIDIDLPISGSLNDPQFSLVPIVFKVIGNLIVKAVTAPFSLLAGAFGGGGEELGAVAFEPGSAALRPAGRQSLDKVAKALTERPSLRMTVAGTADLQTEREAFRRERLRSLVQAEKRRVAVLAGQTATAAVSVSEAEYPALLKEVYRRADMPKPRNFIGLAKDLPAAEMEALLLAGIPASDDAMRELALQRAVAVRDYLASRDLPAERLFLGAARVSSHPAGWSPRAELNLAMQ